MLAQTLYTFIKIVTLIVASILAFTDIYTIFIARPTTTEILSEPLTSEHFPDINICPFPGYNLSALSQHGFQGFAGYLFGILLQGNFVNFRGKLDEEPVKIEKNLKIDEEWDSLMEKLEIVVSETKKNDLIFADLSFKQPINPINEILTSMGFCFRVNPEKTRVEGTLQTLRLHFNSSFMRKIGVQQIYVAFEEKGTQGRILKLSPFSDNRGPAKEHSEQHIEEVYCASAKI